MEAVLGWLARLDPVEVGATASGLASVVLTVRQSVWCWPVGLVMVGLYAWVFFQARLYADMGLQIVYVFLQFYGWHQWLRGGQGHTALAVRRVGANEAARWGVVAVGAVVALGGALEARTDAALPHLDATQTVLSLAATWWMAKKVLECWLLWIAVDALSIGMYLDRGLQLTAGLYGVFLVLALLGWLSWRKTWLQSPAPAWSSASSCPPTSDTSTSSTSPDAM